MHCTGLLVFRDIIILARDNRIQKAHCQEGSGRDQYSYFKPMRNDSYEGICSQPSGAGPIFRTDERVMAPGAIRGVVWKTWESQRSRVHGRLLDVEQMITDCGYQGHGILPVRLAVNRMVVGNALECGMA